MHCIALGNCQRFAIIRSRLSHRGKLSKDLTAQDMVDDALYTLAESLRIIAILISPVLPKAAHEIFDQLNWKMELSRKEERFSLADAEWGRLPDGHVVGKPVPLFPRIEC
jgi:methionyl-tRNA synthetase